MRHEITTVMVGLVLLPGAFQAGCAQDAPVRAQAPILGIAADSVRLRLLDAVTARAIASTEIEIRSEIGILCARPPCPTNQKRWNGRTDAEGFVMAPTEALQVVTTIRTPAHYADLIRDSYEAAGGAWDVEMFPRNAPPELEFHPLDLKLIDARSLRPIADTPVRIAFGSDGGFEGTTNSLGYIFIPVEAMLGDTIDSRPLARPDGGEQARIMVAGYHTGNTDFSRANRKLLLKRR
jgi:hypothetical protein